MRLLPESEIKVVAPREIHVWRSKQTNQADARKSIAMSSEWNSILRLWRSGRCATFRLNRVAPPVLASDEQCKIHFYYSSLMRVVNAQRPRQCALAVFSSVCFSPFFFFINANKSNIKGDEEQCGAAASHWMYMQNGKEYLSHEHESPYFRSAGSAMYMCALGQLASRGRSHCSTECIHSWFALTLRDRVHGAMWALESWPTHTAHTHAHNVRRTANKQIDAK